MVAPLLIAALLASEIPTTIAVATVPAPDRSMTAVTRSLAWLERVEPRLSPRDLARRLAALGIDPFAPGALAEQIGTDPKAPLTLWMMEGPEVLVFEMRLAHPGRFTTWLEAGRSKRPWFVTGAAGLVHGTRPADTIALIRDGRRLFLQVGGRARARPLTHVIAGPRTSDRAAPVSPLPAAAKLFAADPRLAPAAAARAQRRRPRRPSGARGQPPPDALIRWPAPERRVERIEAAAWVDPRGLTLRADLHLTTGAALAASELATSRARARPLLAPAPDRTTADARLRLTPSGMRILAGQLGVPARAAAALGQDLHIRLRQDGGVEAAARLGHPVQRDRIERLLAAVRAAWPGVRARHVANPSGADAVVASLAPAAEAVGLAPSPPATPRRSAPAPDGGAIEATVVPHDLVEALDARSSTGDGIGVRAMEMSLLRLVLRGWLEATDRADLSVRFGPSRIETTLRVRYRREE